MARESVTNQYTFISKVYQSVEILGMTLILVSVDVTNHSQSSNRNHCILAS